ncbi:MAG: glutamine-hydrolyzing carbamoyl-phosphate synthase small subunit [Candidatus Bipolaricaulota bacterium]|nr:glutamine-hydrolyzing carbamoyl-phosphate synthase small subunit [Candidatus Bipolaricaulota bacterium]MBS3792449.1 glutamine-hydrolyzing carbamoyl-phosphate synthase small subunit [Candidatus Bipolaricaulota bacterium]
MNRALLALEDGTVLGGEGIGTEGVSKGELVFTTSFTGYEEALTDPSYNGQNLMFTYPLIGNYGIQGENPQSDSIKAQGMVAREVCSSPDHAKSRESLDGYLTRKDSRGIAGVDTRALTLMIRKSGTVKSAIAVGDYDAKEVLRLAKNQPPITEKDLVPEVSTEEVEFLGGDGPKLAAIDTGIKQSILTNLRDRDFEIALFPHDVAPETIDSYGPDGLFFTNGPGDPKRAKGPQEIVRSFFGELPMFGICFGTQILSLALGGETYKLKFGHRGANQPVKNHASEIVNITAQNHGFAVDEGSLSETDLRVTETNAIDGTVEAIESRENDIFAVQYHPEASPGPRDNEEAFFERTVERLGGR